MDFDPLKLKNMGMPARHISSQSFDEILSDLGDDPAIPDPHGIRKAPPHPNTPPRPSNQSNQRPILERLDASHIPISMQKLGILIAIVAGVLIASVVAFFIANNALNKDAESAQAESQKQFSELKKEIALLRDDFHQEQEDLYREIDKLEVSIHSLADKKPSPSPSKQLKGPTFEAELRRWRFLGAAQMGSSHQGFFNTGKGNAVFEKGVQVLGEWRLSNLENGVATFTHPQGKLLVLKAALSE